MYCRLYIYPRRTQIHTGKWKSIDGLGSDVFQARYVHNSSAKACGNGGESTLLNLGEEDVVLVRELFVVSPDLADHTVRADTVGAFGVVLAQTANKRTSEEHEKVVMSHAPLVIAVVAHEVYAGQVELPVACSALRDVEHAWMLGV